MNPLNRKQFLELLNKYSPDYFEIGPEIQEIASHYLEINQARFFDVLREFSSIYPQYPSSPDSSKQAEKFVILDVGCFPGTLFKCLEMLFPEQFGNWDLVGTGLLMPEDFMKFFAEKGIRSYKVNHDPLFITDENKDVPITIPLADNSVDLIFCTEVLEHLVAPTFLILEMKRVLKPRGCVILTTPNLISLSYRLRILLGIPKRSGPHQFLEYLDWRPHFCEYTAKELTKMFEGQGLTVEKLKYENLKWSEGMLKKKSLPYRICRYLFDLLLDIYPPFSQGILMVIRKPSEL